LFCRIWFTALLSDIFIVICTYFGALNDDNNTQNKTKNSKNQEK